MFPYLPLGLYFIITSYSIRITLINLQLIYKCTSYLLTLKFHDFSTALQFYLRSETLGSSGISNPPRSIIEIDGIDYSKHLDGMNIATIDITTGNVESSVNFRIDSDQSAALPFINYLQRIPGMHIILSLFYLLCIH